MMMAGRAFLTAIPVAFTAARRVLRVATVVAGLAVFGGLAVVSLPDVAFAVEPGEQLADPALEARARGLSAKLRCLVCQNQSIDDSNAPLAKDLRLVVRERLATGASDDAVMDYVVARYGDFVLLQPPFKVTTLVLWIAPLLCLLGIGYALTRMSRLFPGASGADGLGGAGTSHVGRLGEEALSADEEGRLAAVLAGHPADPGRPVSGASGSGTSGPAVALPSGRSSAS